MSCSQLKVNQRLRGNYRLHLQGGKQSSLCFRVDLFLGLFFYPHDGGESSIYYQLTTRRYIPEKYVYDYITKSCRQQAEVNQNHEN
jgi:hypothetical protein